MSRRFAIEWLWWVASCLSFLAYAFVAYEPSPLATPIETLIVTILIGTPIYLGTGIVRLTVRALRAAFGGRGANSRST